MVCPKCHNSVADDSNFCPRCGTPFKKRGGFVANLWRDNKPGFLILSLLLVAMLGSIGYYLSSRTGRFVVTVEKITRDEALDIYAKAALKTYCKEFRAECEKQGEDSIEKNIRRVLPKILSPVKTIDVKITYQNNTSSQITVERFLFRNPSEEWRVEEPKLRYAAKLQQLRVLIESNKGNVPFETKLQLADTLALTENHGSFTLQPGEQKVWRLGYNAGSEAQIEYTKNGKTLVTPALRLG
jgi:ribosomal protein S20